jgi:hypothetical protein
MIKVYLVHKNAWMQAVRECGDVQNIGIKRIRVSYNVNMDYDRVNLICVFKRKNGKNIEKFLKNLIDALEKTLKNRPKNRMMRG